MKGLVKYRGLALLALLVVVAPLLVWQYALSGTVDRLRQTGKNRKQIAELRAMQSATNGTPQGSADGDAQISTTGREMVLSGELIGALLPTIEAEKLRIEHFSPCVTSDSDGVRLTTGQLSVEGRFAGIVKLLDFLERRVPHCKVVSAHFRTARPRNRNETKTLSCTIYIQQITTSER